MVLGGRTEVWMNQRKYFILKFYFVELVPSSAPLCNAADGAASSLTHVASPCQFDVSQCL